MDKNIITNLGLAVLSPILVYLAIFNASWLIWVALAPLIILARNYSLWRVVFFALFAAFFMAYITVGWLSAINNLFALAAVVFVAIFWFLFIVGQQISFWLVKPPYAVLIPPLIFSAVFRLFSFNPFGNFLFNPAILQPRLGLISWLLGEYGIIFFILLANSLLAFIIIRKNKKGYIAALLFLAVILPVGYFYGFYAVNKGEKIKIALLQGNFSASWEERQNRVEEIFTRYQKMTYEVANQGASLIVWPEYALPADLLQEKDLYERVSGLAKSTKSILIVGAEAGTGPIGEDGQVKRYNAVFVFGRDGQEIGRYYAVKPWPQNKQAFPGVDFPVFKTDIGNFAISVCFEDVDGDFYKNYKNKDIDFFVVVSNGSPIKNYNIISFIKKYTELRAAENKKYFLRATNTGATGVIDPYGFVTADLPMNEEGILVADIFLKNTITKIR